MPSGYCLEDHPRSRGNNYFSIAEEICSMGSPPLAREQLPFPYTGHRFSGITPARAGTTISFFCRLPISWDHPRSRGNNVCTFSLFCPLAGSPPLAREQPSEKNETDYESRITPARAGTTNSFQITFCLVQDHPRSRGNNSVFTVMGCFPPGSPPLAREQP